MIKIEKNELNNDLNLNIEQLIEMLNQMQMINHTNDTVYLEGILENNLKPKFKVYSCDSVLEFKINDVLYTIYDLKYYNAENKEIVGKNYISFKHKDIYHLIIELEDLLENDE